MLGCYIPCPDIQKYNFPFDPPDFYGGLNLSRVIAYDGFYLNR